MSDGIFSVPKWSQNREDMERYGKIWKDDDQLADLEVPDSRTKPDGQTFRNHFDLHWPMTGPKCVDAFS